MSVFCSWQIPRNKAQNSVLMIKRWKVFPINKHTLLSLYYILARNKGSKLQFPWAFPKKDDISGHTDHQTLIGSPVRPSPHSSKVISHQYKENDQWYMTFSLQHVFMNTFKMQNHPYFFNIRTNSAGTLKKWCIWSKISWKWVYQVRPSLGWFSGFEKTFT